MQELGKHTVSCLSDLVIKVADTIRSVPKEIQSIKGDLNRIQASIVTAAKEDQDVMKEMKETVFSIEDIIDDYESSRGWEFHDFGCTTLPHETADLVKSMMIHLEIAWKIKSVKSQVEKIEAAQARKKAEAASKIKPSLEQTTSHYKGNTDLSWKNLRELPLHMEATEIVGLEDHFMKFCDWLEDKQPKCTVITVVGMGGSGKTTLARKVFYNCEETRSFECEAWITVSKFSDREEMLKDMLRQFNKRKPRGEMSREEYLKKTRYVVFFDDVWREQFWEEIKFSLENKNPGSMIIITSRNKKVVNTCMRSCSGTVEVLEMEPLTRDESLKLFHKTAFLNDPEGPERHRDISCMIVEKCVHSPLGILAIGREVAADRKFPLEWERHIKKNADMTKILKLSYDDLPEYLKPCFLYFGMYPEDHEVRSERLIRQWIAEGFIISEKRKTLEEVAKEYLQELIDRSLVQVSSFNIDGKAKSCSIHYLVRSMIHRIFEDLSFCQFIGEDSRLDKEDIIRRLSIAISSGGGLDVLTNSASSTDSKERIVYSFMRSLLLFTKKELDVSEYTRRIFMKCTQLKVLDFENSLLRDVPDIIGNSIKLKYLSFRNTNVRSLPYSIAKLENLETLDLRQTQVKMIPNEVSKLRKLRHLLGDDISLIQLNDGIADMKFLQTLYSIKIDDDGDGLKLIEKLGKLEQIRHLGLSNVMKEHGSAICSSLNKMQDLEKLHIVAKDENEIDLQSMEKRSNLRKLHLQGKLSRVPEWIRELQNFHQLVLSMSKLANDPLLLLTNILNLRSLSIIHEGYEGACLHFHDGGFRYLEELELGSLHSLKSITIDSKSLPSLKKIKLRDIPQLKEVPSGIKHLKNLEDLNIEKMKAEFESMIGDYLRQEHSIIQHVLRVIVNGKLVKDEKPQK
ncbi:disease resistance protein RPM1-like [Abrus precatorius]|uniref:Disease resistance protein RPM1-like n=1 Tax=Abrus precatorius TaxID=3816 RepID=A0A8B8KG95_ABRPR|nr:disease resistance protein RPM1-like [Abrus precatorius]